MKLIGLKEAKARLSEFVEEAQRDRILITRRGRPAALVIGVEGQDIEQIVLRSDSQFWKMIEERRQGTARLATDDVRRSFGIQTQTKSAKAIGARAKKARQRKS